MPPATCCEPAGCSAATPAGAQSTRRSDACPPCAALRLAPAAPAPVERRACSCSGVPGPGHDPVRGAAQESSQLRFRDLVGGRSARRRPRERAALMARRLAREAALGAAAYAAWALLTRHA